MVAFSTLFITLSSIAGALAAPASTAAQNEARGPHDFVLRTDKNALTRREAINYQQDYTTDNSVQYSPNSNGFSVNWSNSQDFVVGVGWQTGTTSPINFGGEFSVNSGSGTGLLAVYGWTTDPLIEYYVIENAQNPPQQGEIVGSFESDGSSYTIWKHQQVNQPSIVGTATFWQYISIRNSPRNSGTVTIANHFNQWASLGLNLGNFNYQVIAVEGWGGSSGSAQQTVSN